MSAARLFVGTSGWNYKHWRNSIYPEGLPQREWLAFTASRFNTVELNTSFYRIPTEKSVLAWQEIAPAGFQFAVKLWRGITHYRKLINTGEFVMRFLDVMNHLQPRSRGPVLVQLPPNQGKDLAKLEAFIDEWHSLDDAKWRVAFEFRNPSWLSADVYKLLDRKRVALCIHDMQHAAAVDEPNDAKFVYIRRHGGSAGRYAGSYSPEQIGRDAARIREWLKEGRDVYVYYNNDIGGHAFRNALTLKDELKG
jgi:uncharacterized protein YecE (DUF72 family)